jgi:hypothetical protein
MNHHIELINVIYGIQLSKELIDEIRDYLFYKRDEYYYIQKDLQLNVNYLFYEGRKPRFQYQINLNNTYFFSIEVDYNEYRSISERLDPHSRWNNCTVGFSCHFCEKCGNYTSLEELTWNTFFRYEPNIRCDGSCEINRFII